MNSSLLKNVLIVFTGILMFQNCIWQHKSTSELLEQKGGMIFTLKVENEDILRTLASNPHDSIFKIALHKAIEAKKKDNESDFIILFTDAYHEVVPNGNLASLFVNSHLQQINYNSSKEEVITALKNERNNAIENICNILSYRIENLGVNNANVQKLDNLGHILVELPGIKEPGRIRVLLTDAGNLEFWETYDITEVFEFLRLANTKLKELKKAEPIIKTKTDSDTTEKEELTLIKKLEEQEDIEEITIEDNFVRFQKENPLFSVLRPNVRQNGQLVVGTAAVGIASIKDTAKINEYLRLEQIQQLFPKSLKLLWESKPFDQNKEYINLVAIKITNHENQPALDGSVISESKVEFDQQGMPGISIKMNQKGASQWARLTRENIGKQIAIVFQNKVFSFPTVNSEITGGRSSITGSFTFDEAKDLATIINSGKLPASIKLVNETIVAPSNN